MTILQIQKLGFPWQTADPFLFCAYHKDAYPKGNPGMAPDPSYLTGRRIGMDFDIKDGFRMYHGDTVPGFPQHPHRGFETITVLRSGHVDHSDSLGATARFGPGDVQWMTAGKGIVHSEMFPLINDKHDNPLELFQIWLNLPKRSKMVDPYFTMIWDKDIPEIALAKKTKVRVIAGHLAGLETPAPPPDSWANQEGSEVRIWTIDMENDALCTIPASSPGLSRTLYFYDGGVADIMGQQIQAGHAITIASDAQIALKTSGGKASFLLLEGKPIAEPVVHHGPFVMNTQAEIQQAFIDYRATQFGGWPWGANDPIHARDAGRFAVHADGRKEKAI